MSISTQIKIPDTSKRKKIETVPIMDVDFINLSQKDFLSDHIQPLLMNQEKCYIVTANPEIVMKIREDRGYQEMVKQATYIVPDGAGVVLASKYMKQPIKERIAGFDLMLDILEFANREALSCYFIGAEEQVNKKAVEEVKKRYPNVRIAGRHHGYFSVKDPEVAERVKLSEPDIVFVALGSPNQDKWITNNLDQFPKGLFMGVGGSFDVLAGEVKRAPDKWIKLNLEWLYRLLKQPFRWKRILKAMEFMIRIIFKRN